ncbi:hypothetical protein GWI33_007208 [Rhynchophorus ferrugineus]|uniref:Uncharacterized protein n=1 Tax=Rhynchophorus ferrugineus TaxID=354439 RepID=A0A834IEI1_RHYFE|nr:hypothetical protein GWI33_007208 [Rhynchophorus ferrugineus]
MSAFSTKKSTLHFKSNTREAKGNNICMCNANTLLMDADFQAQTEELQEKAQQRKVVTWRQDHSHQALEKPREEFGTDEEELARETEWIRLGCRRITNSFPYPYPYF